MSDRENKKPTPAKELSDKDLEILKEKTTDIPGLIQYAHERGGFAITIKESDAIKHEAINSMQEQVEIQLQMLHERMQVLAKQAQELKNRALISQELASFSPGFTPVPGQVYFLYIRHNDERVLSLIGPWQWKEMPFREFVASVRYLSDKTWQLCEDDASK